MTVILRIILAAFLVDIAIDVWPLDRSASGLVGAGAVFLIASIGIGGGRQ